MYVHFDNWYITPVNSKFFFNVTHCSNHFCQSYVNLDNKYPSTFRNASAVYRMGFLYSDVCAYERHAPVCTEALVLDW